MTKELLGNLQTHLQQIVRERDPYMATGGHFYAQEYIGQELAKFGELEQYKFEVRGKLYENLILNLCPNQRVANRPPILIGAHYDTVPGSPGADDNATGVAVLLELARFFSSNAANFPIRLVAFDLEEYGLLGSTSYANFLKEQNQSLRLMISLEMLGYCDPNSNSQLYPPGLDYFYPSEGNFIAVIGNLSTISDLISMSREIRKNIPCDFL